MDTDEEQVFKVMRHNVRWARHDFITPTGFPLLAQTSALSYGEGLLQSQTARPPLRLSWARHLTHIV